MNISEVLPKASLDSDAIGESENESSEPGGLAGVFAELLAGFQELRDEHLSGPGVLSGSEQAAEVMSDLASEEVDAEREGEDIADVIDSELVDEDSSETVMGEQIAALAGMAAPKGSENRAEAAGNIQDLPDEAFKAGEQKLPINPGGSGKPQGTTALAVDADGAVHPESKAIAGPNRPLQAIDADGAVHPESKATAGPNRPLQAVDGDGAVHPDSKATTGPNRPLQASVGPAQAVEASLTNEAMSGKGLLEVVKLPPALAGPLHQGVSLVSGDAFSNADGVSSAPEQREVPVATIRNVGEVTVRSVRHLVGSKNESIQIRLVPRSLGELTISVTMKGDKVEVVVSSPSAMVREVLEERLVGLKETLLREGVDVLSMKVQSSARFDTGSLLSHSHSRSQEGGASTGQARPDGDDPGKQESEHRDETSSAARARRRSASHDGDLNVFV